MTDIDDMYTLHRSAICLLLATGLAACAHHAMPRDVERFVQQRELCDHLRGEIPDPDPEHPEDMDAAVEQINRACKGTDAALHRLKARHAGDAKIMAILSRYENRIEANH